MANARAFRASTWGTRPPSLNFRDYWAQEERFARLAGSVRGRLALQRAAEAVDFLAELPAINRPVLTVVGLHDLLCGPRWSAALPDSTRVVLQDSGDFGHIETPEEFTAEATTFVAIQGAAP